ncbi:MAG TPA: ankyrin repeat domain-containing protein [Capsulimonadaceae bacterium]
MADQQSTRGSAAFDVDGDAMILAEGPQLSRKSILLAVIVCLVIGVIYTAVTQRMNSRAYDSLLHRACYEGDLQSATRLVASGANVNLQGPANLGDTPLMLAISNDTNRDAIVALLLTHGADVRLKNQQGRTALHVAVLFGSIPIVQRLIEHGADINALDREGHTPLSYAGIWSKDKPMKQFLTSHGAR